MVNKIELENRIIPYKMLLRSTSTMLELADRILSDTAMPSLISGLKGLETTLQDVIERAGEGLPIVGYHFALPSEYLTAFDCVPICIESVSFMLASMLPEGGIHKYFDMITNYGHPYHSCSAQKGIMGMTLDDLIQFDAIITPTAPCDNTCASYPFFELQKKFPVVVIDMPFMHDEESFRYCGDEVRRGLEELGGILKQDPDYEKMKQYIRIENKVNNAMMEIFELKKAIPCPVDNMSNALSAAAQIFMAGRQEKIDFYNDVLESSKKRLKEGIHHGGEEKIRSIWPYMLTFFSLDMCEWFDRHLGMSILFDVFNYNFTESIELSNEDKMFYGMGKKIMQFPMTRQSSQFYYPFLEECVQYAKEFSADCFIYTSSIACKQFGSIPQILREALKEEVGIPMLIIDLDVADPRITNAMKVKEKILTFTQTLL
ncbi:MAG: 2-hydroxyacyl-CoA dehydratase [Promethearchaeota archaeon]